MMIKLSRLLPREDKFYRLLQQLSDQSQSSARHLKTYVESSQQAERERAAAAIIATKAEAKKIVSEITRELCFTFVTPFDREDIQDFAADLYKITKTIEKVCERLRLHDITNQRGDLSRQTDLIVQEAEAMDDMVKALIAGNKDSQILDKVAVLQDLENKGDAVLGELLVSLFKQETDTRNLILRKDMYDMLEKVIDRYRDAAGVALQIVLKHS